jgi:acyl carrier protein
MTDPQILDLIRAALFEVAPTRKEEFDEVGLDTKIDDLALDSIALMEMVGYVEDRLETTFEEDQLAKVTSLQDLATLIRAGGGVG